MKRNQQDLSHSDKIGQLLSKGKGSRTSMCQFPLHIVIGPVALLLAAILGTGSLTLAKNAYAQNECGILFLCPTPTPSPDPTPTPTSISTPTPIPSPTQLPTPIPSPTPLPALSSTVTANMLPPATPTQPLVGREVAKITTSGPTSNPAMKGGNDKLLVSSQLGKSGFSSQMMIATFIFFCLLFGLGIGLFFFRRMLLPSIAMNEPLSEAKSWSCTRLSNLRGPGDDRNTKEAQAIKIAIPSSSALANDRFGSPPGGFTSPSQTSPLSNTSGVPFRRETFPTSTDNSLTLANDSSDIRHNLQGLFILQDQNRQYEEREE